MTLVSSYSDVQLWSKCSEEHEGFRFYCTTTTRASDARFLVIEQERSSGSSGNLYIQKKWEVLAPRSGISKL